MMKKKWQVEFENQWNGELNDLGDLLKKSMTKIGRA